MGPARLGPAELAKLTDERIAIVKFVLQLTPDQEKYWPAIADAIRFRAQNRDARFARITETVGKMSDESANEVSRNRDPVAFLDRRADALAQRAQDLKKLADAWRPLYPTLSPNKSSGCRPLQSLHCIKWAMQWNSACRLTTMMSGW